MESNVPSVSMLSGAAACADASRALIARAAPMLEPACDFMLKNQAKGLVSNESEGAQFPQRWSIASATARTKRMDGVIHLREQRYCYCAGRKERQRSRERNPCRDL